MGRGETKAYLHRDKFGKQFIKIVAILLLSFSLCSCQKRPQVTIYMGPNTTQNPIDGLHVVNGDDQAALDRCRDRLQQYQEDSIEAADVYSLMGEIYADYVDDREQAVYYLEKAIEIHQRENDEIGLAQDYGGMAEVCVNIDGKIEEGLDYLEKAESLYRKNGLLDSFGLAIILSQKGQAYTDAAQYERALEAFQEAQKIHIKRNEESINIHLFTGKTYIKMQDYEAAKQELLEAQRLCTEKGNQYKEADVNRLFGDLYLELADYNQAIGFYEKALEFYQSNEIYSDDEAFIYNSIAYTYDQSGNVEKAIEASIKTNRIMENLGLDSGGNDRARKIYKKNLELYYEDWAGGLPEEGFGRWYQKVVVDGDKW